MASMVMPSMEPGQPSSNMRSLYAGLVAHCPPSRWLNEVAPWNMDCMYITLDTSQQLIPAPVKAVASLNI